MRSESSYVRDNLRRRCRGALDAQGLNKNLYSFDLVCDSTQYLMNYLLWLEPDYSRKTHHVDHVTPLSRLNLSNKYHRQLGFSIYNLHPLTIIDNKRKFNKIDFDLNIRIEYTCKMAGIELQNIVLNDAKLN